MKKIQNFGHMYLVKKYLEITYKQLIMNTTPVRTIYLTLDGISSLLVYILKFFSCCCFLFSLTSSI